MNAETKANVIVNSEVSVLQWGRVLMNAETRRGGASPVPPLLLASMGPRSHERGNKFSTAEEAIDALASMGPRSHERGNANPYCDALVE